MRVLVTGGAGFIGSHVVEALLDVGHDVAVVDDLSTGRREHLDPRSRFYEADVASPAFETIVAEERPECIIHQAAQVDVRRSVEDPSHDARVNILGSINVLEACRRHGVRKVVYASSAAVYGDPETVPICESHPIRPTAPYGISKHTVEHYLETYRSLYGIEYTALRYANVYGPRQDPLGEGGVVAIFTHRVVRGLPATVFGDGAQTRDLVNVRDVARANLLALDRGDGEIVNISCATETSVNELLERIRRAADMDVRAEHAPARPGEIQRSALANDRAGEVLGWRPEIGLDDGLSQVVQYERSRVQGASGATNSAEGPKGPKPNQTS